MPNILYYGDNLDVLRKHVADESVDLVYLDPPFNSQRDYNVIFKDTAGASVAQVHAFEDTWHWTEETARVKEEITDIALAYGCPKLPQMLDGFVDVLGHNDVTAYLTMMAIRLMELKRVLKRTGSLYFHCDPTMSHYVKAISDIIFGKNNFRNEIIWKRSQPKAHITKRFPRSHDVILFYAKSDATSFSPPRTSHDPEYLEKFYRFTEPGTGRRYTLGDLTNPNKNRPNLTYEFPPGSGTVRVWRWTRERMMRAWEEGRVIVPRQGGIPRYKRYLDEMEGTFVTDIWDDVEHLHGSNTETLGYPTQKPEGLLERIIQASSNEDDVVLDPFCGCGTTTSVAHRLKRQWIGIDITHLAITRIKNRLFGLEAGKDYVVIGEPVDVAGATELAGAGKDQFEWWALSLISADPAKGERKKGADQGMDGLIYFVDGPRHKTERIVAQVKGGHVDVSQIRDLRGVIEREKAAMGFFICLAQPTRPMLQEAIAAGVYKSEVWQRDYPRIQIRTIEQLFNGKGFDYPAHAATTFKQAARVHRSVKQEEMGL